MFKDLRLIVRDRYALIFLLLVPIVVIVIVAEARGGKGTQTILFPVVDEDQGPVANTLIKIFREHLDVRKLDLASAKRLVATENRAPAALLLPRGMSKRYLSEKPSTIELLTDPAQWKELQAIKVILLLASRETASIADPLSQELITIQERNITGQRLLFSSLEQNVPGFSLMFVLLTLVFTVPLGLRDEEVWGTSLRLTVAPLSQAAILSGKLLARLVVGVAQLLILLLFGNLIFGLSLGHSPVALLLVATVVVFAMASFSLIVAAFAHTREQIIPVAMGVVFLLASLGGLWWPFYDQPKWMQSLGQGAMTTWSIFAIQDVILRDKTMVEVMPKVLFLLVYGLISLAIGLRLFRYGSRSKN